MATRVTMHYWPDLKPGHTIAPPPFAIQWGPGTSVTFDRAFVEQYGRLCGEGTWKGPICEGPCDGDCEAQMFAGAMNVGFEKVNRKPFSARRIKSPQSPSTGKE